MSDSGKRQQMSPTKVGMRKHHHRSTNGGRRRAFRRLLTEILERRVLLTAVSSFDPPANSQTAPVSTNITATFDQNINAATATVQTFAVHSERSGQVVEASVSTEGQTVTFDPATNFFPGERVQVSATEGIQSTSGDPNVPLSWEFFTAVTSGSGQFVRNGQDLSAHSTRAMAMGDLDGDGDLDVLQGNSNTLEAGDPNRVWFNDGNGNFTDSGQPLGDHATEAVALGDLDGDGDLDYMSANSFVQPNRVWLNDGSGRFVDSGQLVGNLSSRDVEFGDVDGDGDLDAYVGNYYAFNRLYLNDGNGQFTDSGQSLGLGSRTALKLGDLDGDGDLDAFVANARLPGEPNRVWLNDGSGVFTESGQSLGNHESLDVSLGDLDGDGDLDAVDSHRLWLNDGSAVFTDSAQAIGTGNNRLGMGDVDGDGDLDIFYNSVLLNNGSGVFTDSGQSVASGVGGVELGDLDDDGDLDAYVAHRSQPDVVWINLNLRPSITLSVDNSTIPEAAGTATITATLSAAHTDPVAVELRISGTATVTNDYTVSGTQIVIPAGATTGTVTITAVQDTVDEPDETVIVDITSLTNAREAGTQQVTTTILDDDQPPVPDVSLAVDSSTISEAAGVATFSLLLSQSTTLPVTVNLEFSGTATSAADYTASATQVVIAAGSTSGSITVTAAQDDVDEPDETVIVDIANVTGGNESGTQQQAITIVDDDAPPSFAVSDLVPTASGFRVEFNNPPDFSDLNLYDTRNAGLGPADVVLVGAASGAVAGSLVADGSALTFIKSGGPLAADTYTVTVRSAANSVKGPGGVLLDGNVDGTAGDDYRSSFTVAAPPAGARTIGIPDFVRGPGQAANLPADSTNGIPITLSNGENVRAADVRIRYNPALLEITGATAPAGGSVVVNTNAPGLAILVFFSSNSLPAGSVPFIDLQASVPSANAGEIYGTQQILDLHGVTIGDGNDNEFPVVVDDAFHLTSYFADVSGNGRINASDASQVARFAAFLDSGFGGSPNADPIVVGDISGNGRINAADASLLARFAAFIPVSEIPAIPGGVAIRGAGGTAATLSGAGVLRGFNEDERPLVLLNEPDTSLAGADNEPLLPTPTHYPAVDRVMVDWGDSAPKENLDQALEDAVDELLLTSKWFGWRQRRV